MPFRILALLKFLQISIMVFQLTMYCNVEDYGVLCRTGGDSCLQLFADKGIPHTKGDSFLYGFLVQGMPDIWQAKVA